MIPAHLSFSPFLLDSVIVNESSYTVPISRFSLLLKVHDIRYHVDLDVHCIVHKFTSVESHNRASVTCHTVIHMFPVIVIFFVFVNLLSFLHVTGFSPWR